MSWIVIDSRHSDQFAQIEQAWLQQLPVVGMPSRRQTRASGMVRIDAPEVLIWHLRDIGFHYAEEDTISQPRELEDLIGDFA